MGLAMTGAFFQSLNLPCRNDSEQTHLHSTANSRQVDWVIQKLKLRGPLS
jgi:hypothetical protein